MRDGKEFKKLADGCHMNWTRDRWRGAKTHVKFCSNDTEESHSCVVWGWKVDFFWESQTQKIMDRPRRTIYIDRKTESLWQEDDVFGGIRRVWSIMSYWSLAKRLLPNAINNNWSIWTIHCLKNDQNIKRGNLKSFFSITMLHHIRQNQFGTRWKHSAGKFSPCDLLTRLGSFRLSLCIDGSRTCWALWFVRRCEKNGSMNSSRQKEKIFTGISINCLKDGKNM